MTLFVACLFKEFAETIMRYYTGLFEARHAFADLHVGIAFGVKMSIREAIFVHDFRRDVFGVHAHVLEDFHGGAEKEVLEVGGAVTSAVFGIGDDTVEVEFGVDNTDSRGADVLESIKTITANRHANTIDIGFAGTHGTDKIGVGDLANSRDFMGFDEKHGFMANDVVSRRTIFGEPLGAATPFIREGFEPDVTIGASEKRVNVFNLASDGMIHFACNRGIMVDGLGKERRGMSASMETSRGAKKMTVRSRCCYRGR